jgi:hypothetical protein
MMVSVAIKTLDAHPVIEFFFCTQYVGPGVSRMDRSRDRSAANVTHTVSATGAVD